MRHARPAIVAALVAFAAGCLQIDTHVKVHEDGSATITEKLCFSRRLLDLEDKPGGKLNLSSLLTREAALERMKHMGKGVRLVSHKVHDAERAARESVAVYKIDDLNELHYVSPFLAYVDYARNNVIRARLYPLYKSESYAGTAGEMAVVFWPTRPPQQEDREKPAGRASPLELQTFRELQPVFRDVLRDFRLRFTLQAYAPLRKTGFGLRGQRSGVDHVDLIDFSDTDLDKHGGLFLGNEEIMLELLQWKLGGPNTVDHTKGFTGDLTVPLFLPWGSRHCPWRQSNGIYFPPSRALFDRHFQGKKLDDSRWAKSPPDKLVPARFEKIGFSRERRDAATPK